VEPVLAHHPGKQYAQSCAATLPVPSVPSEAPGPPSMEVVIPCGHV